MDVDVENDTYGMLLGPGLVSSRLEAGGGQHETFAFIMIPSVNTKTLTKEARDGW